MPFQEKCIKLLGLWGQLPFREFVAAVTITAELSGASSLQPVLTGVLSALRRPCSQLQSPDEETDPERLHAPVIQTGSARSVSCRLFLLSDLCCLPPDLTLEALLGPALGQGPGQRCLSQEAGCPSAFSRLSLLPERRREADAAGVPGGVQGRPLHCAGAVPLRWAGIVQARSWGESRGTWAWRRRKNPSHRTPRVADKHLPSVGSAQCGGTAGGGRPRSLLPLCSFDIPRFSLRVCLNRSFPGLKTTSKFSSQPGRGHGAWGSRSFSSPSSRSKT